MITLSGFLNDRRRRDNKLAAILRAIWQSPGICRGELGEKINLSKGSVTKNLSSLLELGWIVEGASRSENNAAGRTGTGLLLRDDLFFTVGVAGRQEFVLTDAQGNCMRRRPWKQKAEVDYQANCDYLAQELSELVRDIPREKIIAAGFSLSGVFNPDSGEIASSSLFCRSEGFNLKNFMSELGFADCFMINVSHLRAEMEHRFGVATEMKDFIFIDAGGGAGIFLDGELRQGFWKRSGEFGWMQISESGTRLADGRRGSVIALENEATETMLEVVRRGGITRLRDFLPPGASFFTDSQWAEAVRAGDQLAAELMVRRFDAIATGVVNVTYLLNPQAIILDSWCGICPRETLEVVRRKLGFYGVLNGACVPEVCAGSCTDADLARGAAQLATDHFFEQTNKNN